MRKISIFLLFSLLFSVSVIALEIYWQGKNVVVEPDYFHLDINQDGLLVG